MCINLQSIPDCVSAVLSNCMTIYFDMYTHIEHTRLRIHICFPHVYAYSVLYVYTYRVYQIASPDLFSTCMIIYFNMYTHMEHTRLRIHICFLYVYAYCVLYVDTYRVYQIVYPDLFYVCMTIYFNMYTHIEHTRLLYLYTWNYSISNCVSFRAIFCGWRRRSWKNVRLYVQIYCITHSVCWYQILYV